MSAGDAAIVLGIVAMLAFLAALWRIRSINRQLDPPEFTGDQGFDGEGCP